MDLEFDIKFQKECNDAAYEYIKEKLAGGDEEQARRWLEDWEKQSGMSGTFQRLVRQAEAAPEEDQQLRSIDSVIIYSILLPLFSRWGRVIISVEEE
jgi:hypothetical protein